MLKVKVVDRKTNEEKTYELDQESILIGRGDDCTIKLDSKTVSRKHAELTLLANDYFLVDLESGNGTLLNQQKLKPHEKNLLRETDLIRIEQFELSVKLPPRAQDEFADEATDSGIIEIRMIKKVLSALSADQLPTLEGLTDPISGKIIRLSDDLESITLGRDKDCDFIIASEDVSRHHAVLKKRWGGITLTDLQSKNGTRVNDEIITEKVLCDGDRIALGQIRFLFHQPQEVDFEQISQNYEQDQQEIEAVKLQATLVAEQKASEAKKAREVRKPVEPEEPSLSATEQNEPSLAEKPPAKKSIETPKKIKPEKPSLSFKIKLPKISLPKLSSMEITFLVIGTGIFFLALMMLLRVIL